ncbi:unnamed protein product [Brachionus calyciflorus]|uniref:Tr-type G domain-containing protein n=1 Tax=Brachionus calyciflorus TaxID=104777 RepID=A0A813XYU8_9BILA|nr:unnamed protein product [Brachionus calyciflorus]
MNQLFSRSFTNLIKSSILSKSIHLSCQTMGAQEKQARSAIKKYSKKSQLKPILIRSQMTVKELADAMDRPTQHVFDCLEQINFAIRSKRDSYIINKLDVITKIVQLSGFRYQMGGPQEIDFEKLELELDAKDDSRSKRPKPQATHLIRRPPVVTIMGHVDHGKTTLLDSLRGSHIVETEFGGITQHIGAFNVKDKNRMITFLDTPGHAAFSMMRSRGAKCTDIVVLVIAAEDGVMAQTVESINHAKSTGCPIIVAINKIDKVNEAQINRVKQELLKYELIPEEMGGEVQIVPISALKKTNLDVLKEEIWTQAEIMELKGDPKGLVEGYIIESTQDLHKGKLATVLIQRGTLMKGDYLVAGKTWCKVKYIYDENSQNLQKASLSQAVQIMGWKDLPHSGDEVLQVDTEHRAKEICDLRHKKEMLVKQKQDLEIIKKKRAEHDEFYHTELKKKHLSGIRYSISKMEPDSKSDSHVNPSGQIEVENNSIKKLHVIVKADVDGSLEAILKVLETYDAMDKVALDLVHFEVGQVKKSDLEMADTFNALIYCFNIPVNHSVEKEDNKNIKHFNVIYKLFDDLKEQLNNLAPLVEQEELIGEADIIKVFDYSESNKKSIKIAGGKCVEGHLDRKLKFKLVRNGESIVENEICKSLKHLKQDVNTIKRNVEFGFAFENLSVEPKSGDKLVCYSTKMVRVPIQWNLGF